MEFQREIELLKEQLRDLDCPAAPKQIRIDITRVSDEIEAVVIYLLLDDEGACNFQSCDDAIASAFFASGFPKSRFYFDGTDIGLASDDRGLRERGLHFYRIDTLLGNDEESERTTIVVSPRATNPNTQKARAMRFSARFDAILKDRAARLSRGDSG